MGSTGKAVEVSIEVFPYLRVYNDGTVERLVGTEIAPAGLDPDTQILSKDIVIVPETGVSVRLYRPNSAKPDQKLPLVVYFHGGAFCISSTADPKYHASLNKLVAEANIILVSVNYRLAPEFPLPTAYDDCWAALQWVASHVEGAGDTDNAHEAWLQEYVDFDNVFLVGDSAGSSLAHHLSFRVKGSDSGRELKVRGIGMINPYFWGKDPIGVERSDEFRKKMVDNWWTFVCTSDKGCDDPLINPFVNGAPSLDGLGCERVLVIVAEKDILRDRGRLYYKNLVNSGWPGKAEIMEVEGEDHVFHIFDPNTDKAKSLIKRLASFINQDNASVM